MAAFSIIVLLMIYIHKLLPIFISPLFIALLLAIGSFYFKSRWLRILPILILLIASNPIIARALWGYLEKDYQPQFIQNAPEADYVVVLGGMLRTLQNANGEFVYEFNEAGDRFFEGVELWRNMKAPKIVFIRGELPWTKGLPEGEVLAQWAQDIGVPANDILLSGKSENTADEAKAVKALVPEDASILLVTSAYHMPRAMKIFQDQALCVTPYAVDFRVTDRQITAMDFLPSASALAMTTSFEREMIGRLYYTLK